MPVQVLMPALSPTMEKGNLAKWLKKEGDPIKTGDVIAEIETDKATMEVEAIDDGTLGKILVPEGTNDVAVNTPIATILAEGERQSRTQRRQIRAAGATATAGGTETTGRKSRDASARENRNHQAAITAADARTRSPRRYRDGHHDHARSVARRHGRGDAPR